MVMDDYIYFCRNSFCMGDDVVAPNMSRYKYSPENFSKEKLQEYITDYFKYIPRYEWNGFCNGKHIARVICSGDDHTYQVSTELEDNWNEMLKERRTIFFDHDRDEECKFGVNESKYYSKEKAEEVFRRYFLRI